jgi:CheY-like chemotaxis protein
MQMDWLHSHRLVDMILLLEPQPADRVRVRHELSGYGEVCAPELETVSLLGDLLARILHEGQCRLLVLGAGLPGDSTPALIRLLRAYVPGLPVVVLCRESSNLPSIHRVLAVPYTDFEAELIPTVYYLLEELAEDTSLDHPLYPAKTLRHSPSLARLTAG